MNVCRKQKIGFVLRFILFKTARVFYLQSLVFPQITAKKMIRYVHKVHRVSAKDCAQKSEEKTDKNALPEGGRSSYPCFVVFLFFPGCWETGAGQGAGV